jgi:cellulose synthase/poly-beta-1,6-N-acetylglucosamine synthase-like glycosyltransferase
MLLIALLILLSYLVLIVWLYFGFNKVPEFRLQDQRPQQRFSILIPFRNEAQQIPKLLNSLKALNYATTHFEVLFLNDHSTDQSVELITGFFTKNSPKINYQVLNCPQVQGSPKKAALGFGVQQAQYPYIVTTDADVLLPKYWLDGFDEFINHHESNLIVGPVKYSGLNGFLHRFQALDILSLQGSTIGGFGLRKPFMSNGANLCYKKSVFKQLSPYKDNQHIASGDDIFLLQSMLKHDAKKVGYLKNTLCTVETWPLDSWTKLLEQRQRWAAKAGSSSLSFGKLTGLLVFLMNLLMLILPFLVVLDQLTLRSACLIFIVKFSIDLLLLFRVSRFFDETELLSSYPFASLLYPFFCTYVVLKSLSSPYQWKDRRFKS